MKSQINIKSAKEIYSSWDENLSFNELTPTSKVISILEIFEETRVATLSPHCDYLAVISGSKSEKEVLVIIYLQEKRVEAFKSFPYSVCVIYFIPNNDNILLVGSSCGRIFQFHLNSKSSSILEGHKNHPLHISHQPNSSLLISWNFTEVLLWSWPESQLTRRLKIDPSSSVVKADYILDKSWIFVAFHTGVILIWDKLQNMKEYSIEPPNGIKMEFKSFSLSLDGEWIIAVGSQPCVVVYSVRTCRLVQVIHLSCSNFLTGIDQVEFLPYIHPQFPKIYLLQALNCLAIIDFTNSTSIKVLRSPTDPIRSFNVSADGFLLAIVYNSGTTKLYTLPSFLPKPVANLEPKEELAEIEFNVMKLEDQKEEEINRAKQLFTRTKWKDILEEFHEFPSKYRKHIWVALLKLPKNYSLLNEILTKEKSCRFDFLDKRFAHMDSKTLNALKSTLECLSYWSPFLSSVEFLPSFILPFVEIFERSLLLCVETSMTLILNWCRFWFHNWPHQPEILKFINQIISKQDADLWIHFKHIGFNVEEVAWTLLTSAFKMMLSPRDWQVVWDHILSYPPSFMVCVCVSLILNLRQTLLKCCIASHTQQLFHQATWAPLRNIIKRAKQLHVALKLPPALKEADETLRFLPKRTLLPFDIGPQTNAYPQGTALCLRNETHSPSEGKAAGVTQNNEDSLCNSSRNKCKLLTALRPPVLADVAVMDTEKFSQLETACLRNITHTRRKLINRNE